MELSWYFYPLAIVAGLVAGIINTLAGSGSLVTLAMLEIMGVPAHIANATNRVGVAMQSVVGIATFRQSGDLTFRQESYWLIGPSMVGAAAGAGLASVLDADSMRQVIGYVMVIMLAVILFKPSRWLREESDVAPGRPAAWQMGLFFLIGIYGGFIQAGVGVFMLAALVPCIGYSLKEANMIKLVIVLFITIFSLAIFWWQALIWWGIGALIGIGQSLGAWLAARFATRYKNANVWVRRLLIAVVVVGIIRSFNVFSWF